MEEKSNKNTQEFSLKDIIIAGKEWLGYLQSNYKVILIFSFLGALIGFCIALTKKPTYTATLTFALEDEKSNGLGGSLGLAGQLGLDIGGGSGGVFAGSNLIELFKSRSMVEQTLLRPVNIKGKDISLAEMYIQDNEFRDKWKDKPKFKDIQFMSFSNRNSFSREKDSILEVIYKDLSLTALDVFQKDKKVSILSVEVKSTNEVFSKVFCETLAEVVSDFYIESKSDKARINMTILQKQLDSIRGELNNSISGVAVADDKTFGLNPALNVKRVPSARKQVDVQTNTMTLGELVKQTELAKVTLRKETPLIQLIDRPIYPLKKEGVGKIKKFIIGGFLAGFLAILFFVVRKMYKDIMSNPEEVK